VTQHSAALTGVSVLSVGLLVATLLGAQAQREAPAPFQIVETSIDEIHAAYKAGRLTARQLVQGYLDRIDAYDKQGPRLNSIITLSPAALDEADRLDAAFRKSGTVGPLHGIPVLVKDQFDAAGMPTTLGTLVFKDYRPTRDSFVVQQLRKAGAIILGKTTLSEYAAGDTYGSMFGATRNPYDTERTVGGSSGGSGAAISANFATVALGEETVSSIRRPGGWNSVVALRPTPGLVSRSGMYGGYPRPHDQPGPMARSVRDLAILLDAMVGYDPEDPVTALGVGHVPATYTAFLGKDGLKGARIGVLRDVLGPESDPESDDFKRVQAVFDKSLAELRAAGAAVVDPIVIPDLKKLLAIRGTDTDAMDEALRIYLARNPGSPFKTREDIAASPELSKSIPPSKADQWTRPRRPTDLAQYARHLQAREQLAINVAKVMADHKLDAIVHKTVEHSPTLIKDGINPPYNTGYGLLPGLNTFLVFAAAITVPSGFTAEGLPTGMTFVGRPYAEPTLLRLAYAYEQATHHRRPPKSTPALAPSATVSGR
jgi:Asp-tRNA(Asn)/Glu-tRNA(Gln) amidotransferase A subunit family amidase